MTVTRIHAVKVLPYKALWSKFNIHLGWELLQYILMSFKDIIMTPPNFDMKIIYPWAKYAFINGFRNAHRGVIQPIRMCIVSCCVLVECATIPKKKKSYKCRTWWKCYYFNIILDHHTVEVPEGRGSQYFSLSFAYFSMKSMMEMLCGVTTSFSRRDEPPYSGDIVWPIMADCS